MISKPTYNRLSILLVALLTALAACGAVADDAEPEEANPPVLVSDSYFDTDLRQALGDIAMQTGVTILVDESVVGFLTLELDDVPLERALHLMLLQGGYVYGEVEPGVYVVTAPDPRTTSFQLLAETRIVPLSYIKPSELKTLLPQQYIPMLRLDEEGYRVIVEAPSVYADEIVAQIKTLDIPPQQVMIEAMVLETQAGALRDYDLDIAGSHLAGNIAGGIIRYQSKAAGVKWDNEDLVPTPNNMIFGLRWLLQKQDAVLRANPRVVAIDGQQAEIEVGTQQYFSMLTGSAAYAYTRLERVDATIKLVIRPRVIAETGEIMCEIEPSIADVSGTGVGGLPVITMRRAKSTMRLRDGHAVVIGGLIQEQESERVSRVPILSEIPIIGGLFRSTSKSASRREIVILIAPHLLDEDGNVSGQLLSDVLLGAEYQFPQVDAETEQAEPTPSERRERRRRTE